MNGFFLTCADAFISVFEKGGIVLMLFFCLYLFLCYLISDKYFYFKFYFKNDFETFKKSISHISAPNKFLFEAMITNEISTLKAKVTKNFSLIKVLVGVCPLMGLLGTVTGMVSVFDVLAIAGSSDARSMASGISKATVPTMAGMLGALTGMLIVKYLNDYSTESMHNINDYLLKFDLLRKRQERVSAQDADNL